MSGVLLCFWTFGKEGGVIHTLVWGTTVVIDGISRGMSLFKQIVEVNREIKWMLLHKCQIMLDVTMPILRLGDISTAFKGFIHFLCLKYCSL